MLVLMRHGQASFGAAHYDKLSDLGMAQARATGAFLRERNARHGEVCVGPRARHRSTALGVLETWGAEPVQREDARVDEFADSAQILAALESASAGAGTGDAAPAGESADRTRRLQRLMQGIDAWSTGALAIEGCESFSEFRSRVGRWLHSELESASHAAPRLVVTSAGVVAASFCEVLQLPDSAFAAVVCQVRNASLTEIGKSRARAVVVSFNDTGHLPVRLVTAI